MSKKTLKLLKTFEKCMLSWHFKKVLVICIMLSNRL